MSEHRTCDCGCGRIVDIQRPAYSMSGFGSAAAAARLELVRDGMIFGPHGTEIDFRTADYSVWLTIKADTDAEAEAVAAALEAAFTPRTAGAEGSEERNEGGEQ